MFFLMGMGPGFWLPALTNIMRAAGWSYDWVAYAFVVLPLSSMLSPLCGGALADQKISAQKLAAWLALVGSVFLGFAFWCLERQLHPAFFVTCFLITSIISAPMWGLITTVAMTHLPNPEQGFPRARLWATLGWILAGWLTSYVLHADAKPLAGYAGTATRLLLAWSMWCLPHTPPRGQASSWRSLMGFDAFKLLRQRQIFVCLIASCVLSMPLTAFYMHTPDHLHALGDLTSTVTMSFGQWSEVVAMALTGWLMMRYPIKSIFLWALACCVARFVFFAWAGWTHQLPWMWAGIFLHGLCYTLFFITGQIYLDRAVAVEMRGQMQGLLGLVTNGVGALLGTLGLQSLHAWAVVGHQRWDWYWATLAGFTVLVMLWFWTQFHSTESGKQSEA